MIEFQKVLQKGEILMNKERIAILVDSCADVPKELILKHGLYIIPLSIVYKDKTYSDGVDITTKEVYDNFNIEIPHTSLPSGDSIISIFEKIKSNGYEKVLVITISSNLSGTYNFVRLLGEDFSGLDIFVVDTKTVSLGSGMMAILAAENLEKGFSWEDLKKATVTSVSKTKIFLCIPNLKYLRKGGRIGLVSSIIGESFDIKPIISCNDEGVLYNAAKVRGWQNSLQKMIDLSEQYLISQSPSNQLYNIAVGHGNVYNEMEIVKKQFIGRLGNYNAIYEEMICSVIAVHSGPGVIGIGVQVL